MQSIGVDQNGESAALVSPSAPSPASQGGKAADSDKVRVLHAFSSIMFVSPSICYIVSSMHYFSLIIVFNTSLPVPVARVMVLSHQMTLI